MKTPTECPITHDVPRLPVLSNEGKIYDFCALAESLLCQKEPRGALTRAPIESITLVRDQFDPTLLDDTTKDSIALWYVKLNLCLPQVNVYGVDSVTGMSERIDKLKAPIIHALAGSEMSLDAVQVHLGETVFLAAASRGNCSVLQQLYDMGMNPNRKHFQTGSTALHVAAELAQVNVVAWLLERQEIDVNCQRIDNGCTPLYLAALNGCTKIVQLLLQNEYIDINLSRTDGPLYATPLDVAAAKGHLSCVSQLLSRPGINPHLALSLSKQYTQPDVTSYLLSYYLYLLLNHPEQIEHHFLEAPDIFNILCQHQHDLWEKLKNPPMHDHSFIPQIISARTEEDNKAYARLIYSIFFSEEKSSHPLRRIFSHNDQEIVFQALVNDHFNTTEERSIGMNP